MVGAAAWGACTEEGGGGAGGGPVPPPRAPSVSRSLIVRCGQRDRGSGRIPRVVPGCVAQSLEGWLVEGSTHAPTRYAACLLMAGTLATAGCTGGGGGAGGGTSSSASTSPQAPISVG